eukprot:2150417-Rhodomonas_salina.3
MLGRCALLLTASEVPSTARISSHPSNTCTRSQFKETVSDCPVCDRYLALMVRSVFDEESARIGNRASHAMHIVGLMDVDPHEE